MRKTSSKESKDKCERQMQKTAEQASKVRESQALMFENANGVLGGNWWNGS